MKSQYFALLWISQTPHHWPSFRFSSRQSGI